MSTRRRSSSSSGNGNNGGAGDNSDTAGGQQQEESVTNIKVAVRCRPFSSSESSKGEKSCFRIQNGTACLENPTNPTEIHRFGFDLIYGGDSQQVSVWRDVGVPAMEKAFAGFNTTIFAYGQTGSGKTFSMQGIGGGSGDGAGIIPRMNEELFARVTREREADGNKMFLVTCSYFEIYNEVIYDLLDPNNRKRKGAGLEIREHGVLGIYVKGLQEMVVTSPDSMQRLIDQGMASRTVGSTAMNDTSSRSHSVFTVKVHQKDATDESKSTFAKINLVDLAGSERAKSTGATGARLKEGANINKSLSSLGNVINALVDVANGKKGVFVPYRNSKLTRVLQESLGGNSLTAMLAALSPAACNFEETLSTLKYASRAKSIKVNAVKNEEASQVSRLEEEIRALKQKLIAQQQTASTSSLSSPSATHGASEAGRAGDNGEVAAGDGQGDGGGREGRSGDHGGGGGDRYKQQIAEMEAAMKSTWEEKAKQSESSERERQRLQQQLEEDARREERGRKKRWRVLEDKGDLELSIREAKEVALPTLPARDWLGQVRALVAAENRAKDEATVCAVYQEALARELEGVFSGDSSSAGALPGSGLFGGDLEDDRASVASTNCTAISESGSIAGTGTAVIGGDGGVQQEGDGVAAGGGPARRVNKAITSYDPALLRQLQARLTSLRDARERLHGPLEKAVEEGSKKLLESVDLFSARFSASPHEHVDRGDGDGDVDAGGQQRRDTEARGSEGSTGEGGAGGRDGEKRQTTARQKRWEAKKNEGTRALGMIRRQVVARGRRTPQQWRSGSGGSSGGGEDFGHGAGAAATEAGHGAKEKTRGVGTAAITARFADAEALCPAAEVIMRAVEIVLYGSTSAFGAPTTGVSTPAAAAAAEGVAVAGGMGQNDDDMDLEGGEGSQVERDRYRDILEGLGKAHGVLRNALEPSGGPSCADPAVLGGGVDPAVDAASVTPKAPLSSDAGGAGGNGRGCPVAEGIADGGGAAETSAAALSPEGRVLPPASMWRFRCSAGGRAEGERKERDEQEEKESHKETNNHGGWFTWETAAAASEESEPCEGDGAVGCDDGRASVPVPPPPWVELDFGEVVTVGELDFRPPTKSFRAGAAHELKQDSIIVAGFGKEDADGSIERTEAMVGEVMMGWGGILKSTPPAKLLSRPPVRFLYDLFRAVAKSSGFGENEEACRSKWEDLSGKKDKMRLMDGMVQLVVDTLGLETRPAKGSDIVVGQECAATNRFLQLLALAAHRHQQKAREHQFNEREQGQQQVWDTSGDDRESRQRWAELTARKKVLLAAATSEDGVAWEEVVFVGPVGDDGGGGGETAGKNNISGGCGGTTNLTLQATTAAVRCRHLRLTLPTGGWGGGTTKNSNIGTTNASDGIATDRGFPNTDIPPAAPAFDPGTPTSERGASPRNTAVARLSAFRVRVVGPGRGRGAKAAEGGPFVASGAGRDDGAGENAQDGNRIAQEQAAMGFLLEAMRSAVGRLLEQSVEWGRIEAANQERKTAMRTNKMESLEKRLKASTEAKSRLAKDKKSMAVKAARTEEENLKLQEQVLRLRADVGRERVENASITERLAQAEARGEEEKTRMRELEDLKRHLDGETEDLQNQVEVLTEERDVARSHEEELFAKLTDRTEDLEALQESYVSLTDRWNDFQDEHDEVVEQLESFRATFHLSNHNSDSNNNSNNKNDSNPCPTTIKNAAEAVERAYPAESKSPSEGLDGASQNISNSDQRNHRQPQLGTKGVDGEHVGDGGGLGDRASSTMPSIGRPISGREGRSRSSHAPPRPASGRKIVVRTSSTSSYDDGCAGDFGNNSGRNQSSGSAGKSLDEGLKLGSSPSPRRPPSVSSSVPSPRYCPSPRPSGSGSGSAVAAGGVRRRRNSEEWAEETAGERCRGGDDFGGGEFISDGEKENQWGRGVDSTENRNGRDSAVAEANPCSILHGGDSGGYEDDFDDFVEQESDEGEQQTAQPLRQDALRDTKEEEVAMRGGSGEKQQRNSYGGSPDDTAHGSTPLVEVVYRPPSGGSRGKVERPKSAARQGRSSSLNGAG